MKSEARDANHRFQSVIGVMIAFIFFGGTAAYLYYGYRPVWQFDHLEQNAKKVVTGAELQAWANDLLTRFPTNGSVELSDVGTNFPSGLRRLAPRLRPRIYVMEGAGTNYPAWVRLYWGSGFLGHKGFEVGPTNFVSRETMSYAWQPGVYFIQR